MTTKQKALIVEDQLLISMELQERLKVIGYDIGAAVVSEKGAIYNAKNIFPDLILMDVKLRNGDNGLFAARQIRTFSNVPIVFVSGNSDKETIQNAKKIPFSIFLIKPVSDAELLRAINVLSCKPLNNSHIYENDFFGHLMN